MGDAAQPPGGGGAPAGLPVGGGPVRQSRRRTRERGNGPLTRTPSPNPPPVPRGTGTFNEQLNQVDHNERLRNLDRRLFNVNVDCPPQGDSNDFEDWDGTHHPTNEDDGFSDLSSIGYESEGEGDNSDLEALQIALIEARRQEEVRRQEEATRQEVKRIINRAKTRIQKIETQEKARRQEFARLEAQREEARRQEEEAVEDATCNMPPVCTIGLRL